MVLWLVRGRAAREGTGDESFLSAKLKKIERFLGGVKTVLFFFWEDLVGCQYQDPKTDAQNNRFMLGKAPLLPVPATPTSLSLY